MSKVSVMKEKKKAQYKATAGNNKRFYASGGVCPQTVLWEFGSLYGAYWYNRGSGGEGANGAYYLSINFNSGSASENYFFTSFGFNIRPVAD